MFDEVCATEFPRIRGYIRCRVGDREVADDLTSQTFLRALQRLETFDPEKAALGTWILAIARNNVRDHLRSRRRWRWLPLGPLADPPSVEPSPEQRLVFTERQQALLAALARLSDRERDILGLRFFGGLASLEIARMTGLKEGHVRVIVYRALGRLREHLSRRGVSHD